MPLFFSLRCWPLEIRNTKHLFVCGHVPDSIGFPFFENAVLCDFECVGDFIFGPKRKTKTQKPFNFPLKKDLLASKNQIDRKTLGKTFRSISQKTSKKYNTHASTQNESCHESRHSSRVCLYSNTTGSCVVCVCVQCTCKCTLDQKRSVNVTFNFLLK